MLLAANVQKGTGDAMLNCKNLKMKVKQEFISLVE